MLQDGVGQQQKSRAVRKQGRSDTLKQVAMKPKRAELQMTLMMANVGTLVRCKHLGLHFGVGELLELIHGPQPQAKGGNDTGLLSGKAEQHDTGDNMSAIRIEKTPS